MIKPKAKTVFIILIAGLIGGGGLWWLGGVIERNLEYQKQVEAGNILRQNQALVQVVTRSMAEPANNPAKIETINRITASQLKLIPVNNSTALTIYAHNLTKVLAPFSQPRRHPAEITLAALESGDPKLISRLNEQQKHYQKTRDELLALNVPSMAQLIHLQLINSIDRLIPPLENMAQVLDRPESALSAAESFVSQQQYFLRAVDNINVFFANQGIMFSEEDSLYILTDF